VAYHLLRTKQVRDAMAAAPEQVKDDFEKLLRVLVEHPRPGQAALGVLPLKDGQADEFTAPFDNALLVYRILPLVDYRTIRPHLGRDAVTAAG
jgi:hypothetical protein